MSIHSFAVDTGQVTPSQFSTVLESYRSDVEQRHTKIALHDPETADLRYARQLADEQINVSGAEVKIFVRTENADFDDVWDEDADPTYWNPMFLKGYFKPQPLEAELNKWGLEVVNKTEIVFSHRQLFNELGERMLRAGDVIQLQYNAATKAINPKNYRILNCSPTGNFRYNWLYFTCQIETLTADITVRPEEDMPTEEQDRTGGGYRESL